MKEYFQRLKQHPGLRAATMFTAMGFVAGAQNPTLATTWWQGGLMGMAAMGGICWLMVLLNNGK